MNDDLSSLFNLLEKINRDSPDGSNENSPPVADFCYSVYATLEDLCTTVHEALTLLPTGDRQKARIYCVAHIMEILDSYHNNYMNKPK